MKTILMSAYAVNPYKGSEDGMGWNFICQAARYNKVIAVTRENNESSIRKYMQEQPNPAYDNIRFIYFDLPYWMRFWKRGSRGALLYYYMWQLALPKFIRKSRCRFDITHNLNFHNDWTPSRLWTLGKPFVWGPVGHHPRIPHEFTLGYYGIRDYFTEKIKWGVKKIFWLADPFLKSTLSHADAIIAMNKSVEKVLNLKNKNVHILPSVGSESLHTESEFIPGKFHVLSIGRFVPLKGFDVTVKSFSSFYHNLEPEERKDIRLTLVGKGPSKKILQTLVKNEGISHVVDFIDWLDRDQLKKYYSESSVFLFPSHEGAGMVVAEAMSCGLPVICFDNSGPGEFVDDTCGMRVPYGNYHSCVRKFSSALSRLFRNRDLVESLSAGAIKRFSQHFDWNAKGEQLRQVYESLEMKQIARQKNKVVCVHLLNDYSGSPLVFSEAIKGLVASGHKVDLYTSHGTEGFLTGLPVRTITFPYRFHSNKYMRLLAFSASQLLLFIRMLKYYGQPVDFYINTILPFGAAMAGKVMGKKVIYHLHETSINPPAFKKFLQVIAESTANTAIYVSHFLMKSDPLRGVASSVVYNALPDEFVDKANSFRLHKIADRSQFNVLMICSLKTYKGVPEFTDLAKRMPHIHFDLVLNANRENINRFFEGKNLPANLVIYEATNNVHPFYEKANLVLNLSRPDQWVETFGMTILEAMCYGIPVIAPPVGGVTELVKPNINGYLKDVRSQHDMQNTIHQIYADPNLCRRLSEQAILTAEKFKLSTMQQMVCDIIENKSGK